MRKYVVGLAFDQDLRKVILIRKNRPEWQKGRLNGVGGKVELTDRGVVDAMVREFYEETGVVTIPSEWEPVIQIEGEDYTIWFYRAVLTDEQFYSANSKTDEHVDWQYIDDVLTPGKMKIIHNLQWVLPFAMKKSLYSSEDGKVIVIHDKKKDDHGEPTGLEKFLYMVEASQELPFSN